jgi:integrase
MAKRQKNHHLYKRGDTWYFRKGCFRISLETIDAAEAMRKRDRLLENYRLNGCYTLVETDSGGLSFGAVAKEWAKVHSTKVKYSSWRDYRSAMNTHVLPAFKDVPIATVTYQDVEKFKAGLTCGAKRVNNILVPMRSVFDYAFKSDYVSENVMLKVDNRRVVQPDIFPFVFNEVKRILDCVETFYRPYVAVRFFTGMRAGEIDGLEWADYKADMDPRPKIHIRKAFVYGREGETKTKQSKRYIDCLAPVVEALGEQRALTGKGRYIFLAKDGGRMSPDHFRNVVWTPALVKAGFDYRPPIQTRHSFATMAISAGEVIGWVQNMLGHASLQMIFTRYYAWVPLSTRNDGMAFMNAAGWKQGRSGLDQPEVGGKVIRLFTGDDTKTTHQEKRAHGDYPQALDIVGSGDRI